MAQVISTNQPMREAEIDAVNYINGDLQDTLTKNGEAGSTNAEAITKETNERKQAFNQLSQAIESNSISTHNNTAQLDALELSAIHIRRLTETVTLSNQSTNITKSVNINNITVPEGVSPESAILISNVTARSEDVESPWNTIQSYDVSYIYYDTINSYHILIHINTHSFTGTIDYIVEYALLIPRKDSEE